MLAVHLFTGDINVYGSGDGEFEGIGSVSGVESCRPIMFPAGEGALPSQLFRHLL